jgi:recombination protein RecA
VYKEQDAMLAKNPVTEWKFSESIMYPFSQIVLVTRLMLKDDETKKYSGIRLKVFGRKTRFTKPFQTAMIEVPYDTGMDEYSGLLEAAESLGVITRAGAWYTFNGQKFQSKNFSTIQDDVLNALIEIENKPLDVKSVDATLYEGDEDAEPVEDVKATMEAIHKEMKKR